MRLTVHVTDAKKTTEEKKVKDGVRIVKKTINTYSFKNVKESEVPRILQTLQDEGCGIPTKHYLSGNSSARGSITKKKA